MYLNLFSGIVGVLMILGNDFRFIKNYSAVLKYYKLVISSSIFVYISIIICSFELGMNKKCLNYQKKRICMCIRSVLCFLNIYYYKLGGIL